MAPGAALAVGAVTTRGRVVEEEEQPQVATDEVASVAETVSAVGTAAASVAEMVDMTAVAVRGMGAVGDETMMMAAVVAVAVTVTEVGAAEAGAATASAVAASAVAAGAVAMVHLVPPRTLVPLEGSTAGRREAAWTLRSCQHWPRTPKHWKGSSTERAR